MKSVRDGLIAGLIAGLILAVLFFTDYGPGGLLHTPARWLALDSQSAGKFVGFVLLIVLGSVFGLLFGAIEGRRKITIGNSLLLGAATGVVFWLIVPFLFGTVINHGQLNPGSFLYSFVPLLFYGVMLGSFYFQRVARAERV